MAKKLIKSAKDTVKLGVVSGAGLGAMGAMGSIPGMPAQAGNVTGAVGAGLTLANVGNVANIGIGLTKSIDGQKSKKKTGNKYIDKIL